MRSVLLPLVEHVRPGSLLDAAWRDLVGALRGWRIWVGLGWQDILIRYHRTVLGPWWITVSQSVTFIFLGMLFSAVLKTDIRIYLPYLALGMVTWGFLFGAATEGPRIFLEAHHVINALRMPLLSHVLRTLVRHLLIYFHTLVAALAAYMILAGSLGWGLLQLPLSLLLLGAVLFPVVLLLAVLGARFRDLGPVIEVIGQMTFFMTPIMWRTEDLPLASKWWVEINPVHHLLILIRAPIYDDMLPLPSLLMVGGLAVLLNLLAIGLFAVCRRRIPYWL